MTLNLKFKNQKGYALLELVFYISLFAILSIALINSLLTMTKTLRETAVERQLAQGGVLMERISREIRLAESINSISSSSLKLNTTDVNDAATTVQFSLASGNIELRENNVLTGNLNNSNLTVTALSFTEITTTEGKAVKTYLTVRSGSDSQSRQETFYDTIVLRGSY